MIILFHIFVVAVLQLSHVFASSNLAYKVGRGHPTGSWGLLEENCSQHLSGTTCEIGNSGLTHYHKRLEQRLRIWVLNS